MPDYTNTSQQRILKVLLALGGHEINGLAVGEIAKGINASPPNIVRDLANLDEAGIAEKITDTNRWRLTPRIPQIAMAMLNTLDRTEHKTAEVRQRFTRT
ncbi:MAG: hypothetical protein GXP10_01185 [Gammaproteobacteria bacterium]|nr:hypothetical protein [Gammaproteobacteria bacterium]